MVFSPSQIEKYARRDGNLGWKFKKMKPPPRYTFVSFQGCRCLKHGGDGDDDDDDDDDDGCQKTGVSMGRSRSSASHPKMPCFATFEMRRWSKKITPKLNESSQTVSLVLDVQNVRKAPQRKLSSGPKIPKVLVKKSCQNQKNPHEKGHRIITNPMTHVAHPTCTTLNRSQLQPLGKFNMPLAPLTSCGKKNIPHKRCTTKHDFKFNLRA